MGIDRQYALSVAEASRSRPLRVAFILNDSATVYAAESAVGPFNDDPKFYATAVNTLLRGDEAFEIAAAHRIFARIPPVGFDVTSERPFLRALIRAAVCPR
jgi:hypothetical protein